MTDREENGFTWENEAEEAFEFIGEEKEQVDFDIPDIIWSEIGPPEGGIPGDTTVISETDTAMPEEQYKEDQPYKYSQEDLDIIAEEEKSAAETVKEEEPEKEDEPPAESFEVSSEPAAIETEPSAIEIEPPPEKKDDSIQGIFEGIGEITPLEPLPEEIEQKKIEIENLMEETARQAEQRQQERETGGREPNALSIEPGEELIEIVTAPKEDPKPEPEAAEAPVSSVSAEPEEPAAEIFPEPPEAVIPEPPPEPEAAAPEPGEEPSPEISAEPEADIPKIVELVPVEPVEKAEPSVETDETADAESSEESIPEPPEPIETAAAEPEIKEPEPEAKPEQVAAPEPVEVSASAEEPVQDTPDAETVTAEQTETKAVEASVPEEAPAAEELPTEVAQTETAPEETSAEETETAEAEPPAELDLDAEIESMGGIDEWETEIDKVIAEISDDDIVDSGETPPAAEEKEAESPAATDAAPEVPLEDSPADQTEEVPVAAAVQEGEETAGTAKIKIPEIKMPKLNVLGWISNWDILDYGIFFLVCTLAVIFGLVGWIYLQDRSPQNEDRLFTNGVQHFESGNYLKTITYMKELFRKFKNTEHRPEAGYMLATSYYNTGKYDPAKNWYEDYVRYEESMADSETLSYPHGEKLRDASINIANCSYKLHDYSTSIEEYRKFQENFPGTKNLLEAQIYIGKAMYALAAESNSSANAHSAIMELNKALENDPHQSHFSMEASMTIGDSYTLIADMKKENYGYYQNALDAYKKAMKFNPTMEEQVLLSRRIGDTYNRLGNRKLAIEHYAKTMIADSDTESKEAALNNMAELAFADKDYFKTIEAAEALISDFPKSAFIPRMQYIIGNAYYEMKQFDDMDDTYQFALKAYAKFNEKDAGAELAHLRLTDYYYYDRGNFAEAVPRYRTLLEEFPDGYHIHITESRLGESLMKTGQYKEAAEAYQIAINDVLDGAPMRPDLYRHILYQVGKAYQNSGNDDLAVKAYSYAVEEFPKAAEAAEALLYLGTRYRLKGEFEDSLQALRVTIAEFPDAPERPEAYLEISKTYLETRNFDRARANLNVVINNYPDNPLGREARIMVGQSYVDQSASTLPPDIKKSRLQEAVAQFERNIGLDEKDSVSRTSLAETLMKLERYSEAVEHFAFLKKALEDMPDKYSLELAHWNWREGYAYYKLGEHRKAIDLLEKIKVDKSSAQDHILALYFLAVSYQEEERWGDAEVAFRELLSRYPDSDYSEQAKWNLNQLEWDKDTRDL